MHVEWSLSKYGLEKRPLRRGEAIICQHLITAEIHCKMSPEQSVGSPRCPEHTRYAGKQRWYHGDVTSQATSGNLVRGTTGSQEKVFGKGVRWSDLCFQQITEIKFSYRNMRVIPWSQEGKGILRKEAPMCSGLSWGGACFPCHSKIILMAPFHSLIGVLREPPWPTHCRDIPQADTRSLSKPARHQISTSQCPGLWNTKLACWMGHGLSLLPWLLFLLLTTGYDHLTIRQTLEGPDPRSLSKDQKNEWLPFLHFLCGNSHHN